MRESLVWVASAALGASACSVFTPPTRPFPLETAATAGKGRTGEQLEYANAWGLDANSAAMRVRHGIGDDTDLSLEGAAIVVAPDSNSPHAGPLRIGTGRVGVKQRVTRWLAVTGGLGGGLFADNAFLGPDLGAIASYENRYFIPFVAVRGATSVPLSPERVEFGDQSATPRTEWYGHVAIGGRIPIGEWNQPSPGGLRGAVLVGLSKTWFVDDQGHGSFDAFAVGGEMIF
jgi:hypothetical protein